ncbi:MAG: 50S ribosomal protein L24 [Clostridia bacterium]|nr:50S ribosomal protein L24 [Clostridia bacterium]
MSINIKKGDAVKIIAGVDKGKSGQVAAIRATDKSWRVILEGSNLATDKHFVKPRNAQERGGIIEKERAINISNVMVVCPSCGAATRVAHKVETDDNGKKIKTRICKKCSASLDDKKAKSAAKKTAKKASKTATKAKKTEKED